MNTIMCIIRVEVIMYQEVVEEEVEIQEVEIVLPGFVKKLTLLMRRERFQNARFMNRFFIGRINVLIHLKNSIK